MWAVIFLSVTFQVQSLLELIIFSMIIFYCNGFFISQIYPLNIGVINHDALHFRHWPISLLHWQWGHYCFKASTSWSNTQLQYFSKTVSFLEHLADYVLYQSCFHQNVDTAISVSLGIASEK
jgi:hypothetical protein